MVSSSWSVRLYKIFSFRIIWRWQGNMSQKKSKCPAAARVGINPTPTLAECCNHVGNPLIINMLRAAVKFPHSTATNEIENRCNTAVQGFLFIFVRTGHLAVENGLADETATEGAHTRE